MSEEQNNIPASNETGTGAEPNRMLVAEEAVSLLSSDNITVNKPFTITYNGEDEITDASYATMVHNESYAYDLNFNENEATLTVPDTISAVSFIFKTEDSHDNNDGKGYLFNVLDKDGKEQPESEASKIAYAISYGDLHNLKIDTSNGYLEMEHLLENHPELQERWLQTVMFVARESDPKKAKTQANVYLSELLQQEQYDLKDYKQLGILYNALGETEKSDSIYTLALERYPDSDLAFYAIRKQFYNAESLEDKKAVFNTYQSKINSHKSGDYLLRDLAILSHNDDNMEAFHEFSNMISSNPTKASLYNSIAWPNAEKQKNLELATSLSKKAIELMKAEKKNQAEKFNYMSGNEYDEYVNYNLNMYRDTHALALFNKGDVKEAIAVQESALGKYANPEMNQRYLQFLMADEQYDVILEKAAEFIKDGRSTSTIKEYYKTAAEKSGNTLNIEQRLAALEAEAKTKQMQKLKTKLLDEEAPDFTIKDLDGQDITLSQLKGKTVVLDFWATWCGPCIASFPAMQDVVTKYENDDSVAIYFVDTFESGEDREEKVAQFIEKNEYDFQVLMDPLIEDSRKHMVAEKYGITGIPTKIIIGPSGKIKFRSVGFNGSAEQTVSEIDLMLEVINQPNM